ncbi:MAG: helix-turn-helix domain-containing protein [Patescibacteria group bacterium]|nr:helix-turn-helix domain-containing protein [Patescibacteria group bacterium]
MNNPANRLILNKTLAEVASDLSVSDETVRLWLRKRGIPPEWAIRIEEYTKGLINRLEVLEYNEYLRLQREKRKAA